MLDIYFAWEKVVLFFYASFRTPFIYWQYLSGELKNIDLVFFFYFVFLQTWGYCSRGVISSAYAPDCDLCKPSITSRFYLPPVPHLGIYMSEPPLRIVFRHPFFKVNHLEHLLFDVSHFLVEGPFGEFSNVKWSGFGGHVYSRLVDNIVQRNGHKIRCYDFYEMCFL